MTTTLLRTTLLALCLGTAAPLIARAQPATVPAGDALVLEAREAQRKRDKPRLAALKAAALEAQHPLAPWVDYWELGNRLGEATVAEVEAFYGRWPGSYVEDRLRNDWLLELGRRRDWAAFARDYPRFRMNDDRQVTCYHLLTQHLAGRNVRAEALAAWHAQRDLDDACDLMASTLYAAGVFRPADAWAEARLSVEFNRPRAARAAASLVNPAAEKAVGELTENPGKFLARKPKDNELALLALLKLAADDPAAAAAQMESAWERRLTPSQGALAWAVTGKQAALRLQPAAAEHYARAWPLVRRGTQPDWSDETLAWQVRAVLRLSPRPPEAWRAVAAAVDAMSPAEQREPAWVYWKARALQAAALAGADGEADRTAARHALEGLAGELHFYGKLAAEDLGRSPALPPPPPPLADAERSAAAATPGFARALQLIALGLRSEGVRSEGVREWNFTLRGLGDRELLAAAQLACDREVWDRCINTSDRTRAQVDLKQRFPTPFRDEVLAQARESGLDPAYVYGLIRQESRFITDARSHVGASGLMQLMPATAKWTAKKVGLAFTPAMVTDRIVNLKLGSSYLKLLLDDFGGSQAMAAAAYNAGPGRPRRWREGGSLEPAAWAESIPFNETRDYVKKVLSNATWYATLLHGQTPALKPRLGGPIGPREASSPAADKELP